MKFEQKLILGRLKRRYKRFFADVELEGGELVVAHCPNTGSMKNCLVDDAICWISESNNPKRKLKYTLEAVTAAHGGMAGVNTGRTNRLVEEALNGAMIPELSMYTKIEREVRFGVEKSRLDFRLSGDDREGNREREARGCYVEVKNVTLGFPEGLGMFPDSVTTRGAKHLRELAFAASEGHRAVLFFCVQHQAIDRVVPAQQIDPTYYETLLEVSQQGVEILAYEVSMSREEFVVSHAIPFSFG